MKRTAQVSKGNVFGSRKGRVEIPSVPQGRVYPRHIRRAMRVFKQSRLLWPKWSAMSELSLRLVRSLPFYETYGTKEKA